MCLRRAKPSLEIILQTLFVLCGQVLVLLNLSLHLRQALRALLINQLVLIHLRQQSLYFWPVG